MAAILNPESLDPNQCQIFKYPTFKMIKVKIVLYRSKWLVLVFYTRLIWHYSKLTLLGFHPGYKTHIVKKQQRHGLAEKRVKE